MNGFNVVYQQFIAMYDFNMPAHENTMPEINMVFHGKWWSNRCYLYSFLSLPSFDTPLSCLSDHHGNWHRYAMILLPRVRFIPAYDIEYIITGAACGAGNTYPPGAPDFTSGFHRGSCYPVIW